MRGPSRAATPAHARNRTARAHIRPRGAPRARTRPSGGQAYARASHGAPWDGGETARARGAYAPRRDGTCVRKTHARMPEKNHREKRDPPCARGLPTTVCNRRARPSHDAETRAEKPLARRRKPPRRPLFSATMAHRRAESAGARENTAQDPLPRRSATVAGDLPVTAGNRHGKHADARVNAHFPCARAQPRSVTSRKREPSREALGRRVYTPRGPRRAFCKRRTANAACSFTERTTEAPSNLRKRGRVKKCSIFLHTENRLVYTGKSGAASPLPGLLRLTAPCTRNVCESGAKKNKRA